MSAPAAGFPVEHEEHENHERYLITYADMITLLMALFIILFAIGQTDLEKYRRFAEGASGHASGHGVLEGGEAAVVIAPVIEDLGAGLRRAAGDHGLRSDAVRIDERGVVIELPETFGFAAGDATLTEGARALVDGVADALRAAEGQIVVEGHTDDVVPGGATTNWDLSVRRAVAVVEALVRAGIPSHRLTAVGHEATRPIASNATSTGRAANRRVEIVLAPPQVSAALPPEEATHR